MLNTPRRMQGASAAHRRSPRQEKELAERVGGITVHRSGAGDHEKGDVRLKGVARIEAKTTSAKSFSVTREMVAKIEDAALGAGELPAFVVEFLGPDGRPESAVAVVPLWVLDVLKGGGHV